MTASGEHRAAPSFRFAGLALVLAIVEVLAFGWVTRAGSGPAIPLAFHVLVAACLWLSVARRRRAGDDHTWEMLLAVSVGFLGPVGATGTGLGALLNRAYARSATPFDEWYASMFPDAETDRDREMMEGIRATQESTQGSGIASFLDLMVYGSTSQKRELLAVLVNEFRPEFAPALTIALADADPAIRVQAASATTRITEKFLTRARTQQSLIDRGKGSRRELADLYGRFSRSGILDPSLAEYSREEAVLLYGHHLAEAPDDPTSLEGLSRILLEDGRINEAERMLRDALGREVETRPMLVLFMEALYRKRKFDELRFWARNHFGEFDGDESVDPEAETVRLWALSGKVGSS